MAQQLPCLAKAIFPYLSWKSCFTPHQMEWQRLSHLPIEQQTLVNN